MIIEKLRSFKVIFSNSIFQNISWLFLDKILRLGVGLFIGVWVAKYLGPEQFGNWNYAIAILAVLSALSTLGLDQVVIKKLLDFPELEEKLIGNAFFLRFWGAILASALAIIYSYLFAKNDRMLLYIVILTCLNLWFQSFDIIDLKFQSILKSKITVIIKNSSFLICSAIKIYLIVTKRHLLFFVFISLLELILGAIGLVKQYGFFKVIKWRINFHFAKGLLKDSWPLTLSGIIILLYMRVDQIMIANFLNNSAVGLYSVSVRFTELWYFIPGIFVGSLFPKLIQIRHDPKYQKLLINLFKTLFIISFLISVLISFSAEKLILYLYGKNFLDAAFALKISIWTGIFVFWGVGAGNILVIENLNKHNFYKSILGLGINIILNFIFIPKMGINGAAISTLISQAFASYLYYLFPKKTRHIFVLQSRSILFFK